MAEAVAEEYRSSLCDLNFNSKPHINMLTIIAEENSHFASVIVGAIVDHIKEVPADLKLPGLYLVDSIIKNVGGQYITLFCKHVIILFSTVFEKVEEATRSALFKLRQTWNDILPKNVLYGIDCSVNQIDPAWPITAQVATPSPIHVNPKFVGPAASKGAAVPTGTPQIGAVRKSEVFSISKNEEMRQKQEETLRLIEEKKKQLEELQKRKLEMAAKHPLKVAKLLCEGLLSQRPVVQSMVPDRDPRLKKFIPPPASNNVSDKPVSPIQSVVVVPPKTVPEAVSRKDTSNKHDQRKSSDAQQNKPGITVSDPRKKNSTEKDEGSGKKRPLSSPKKEDNPHKKAKGKNKRSSEEKSSRSPKKEKNSKDTPKESTSLSESSLLFGSRDTDYRQYGIPHNNVQNPSRKPDVPDHELIPSGTQISESNGKFIPDQTSSRRPDEMQTDKVDSDPLEQPVVHKMSEAIPPSVFSKPGEHLFPLSQIPISNERLLHRNTGSPLGAKMFMLDGKNRSIHFVNEKAFAYMDDNTPQEISFYGPPRNVYIEGLSQPLVIGFDGRTHEFETDGRKNTIRFGAPSREIYINNFPYEAVFGGPTFTALLEDKKDHRIRIDGPPPQVLINKGPATELSDKTAEQSEMMRDVDMRMKPSQFVQPPVRPDNVKDVDWRQVPEAPWVNRYPAVDSQNGPMVPVSLVGPPNDWIRPTPPLQPPPSIPAALLQTTPTTVLTTRTAAPHPWIPMPPPHMFESMLPKPPVSAASNFEPLPPPMVHRESSNPLPPEPPSRIPSTPLTFEALKGILAGITSSSSAAASTKPPQPPKTKSPPHPVCKPRRKLSEEKKRKEKTKRDKDGVDVDLTGFVSRLFKMYHEGSTHSLHVGSQCAECGMRFVDADMYSRHLDWHFRMNRREKERIKRAYNRPWFHKLDEWNKFIEFEQAEERTPSYFELQTDSKAFANEEEVPSVASANETESEKCAVCGEMFRLKWKGDLEEWHLFPAVKQEGELYHPLCYDDHVKAIELEKRLAEEAAKKAEEDARRAEEEAKKAAEEAAIKAQEDAIKAKEDAKIAAIKAEEDAKIAAIKVEEDSKIAAIQAEEDVKKAAEDESKKVQEAKQENEEAKVSAEEETKMKEEVSEAIIKDEPNEDEKMEVGEDVADNVKEDPTVDVKVKEEPPDSPSEKPKPTEPEPSSDDEFRPPTPDPRFQVLEPVHRGNELSALCTIM